MGKYSTRLFCAKDVWVQNADKRQVPIASCIVKSISNHKFVRDVKSNPIDLDPERIVFVLFQQRHNLDAGGIPPPEVVEQVIEGQATVYDVFDNQNMPIGDVLV